MLLAAAFRVVARFETLGAFCYEWKPKRLARSATEPCNAWEQCFLSGGRSAVDDCRSG